MPKNRQVNGAILLAFSRLQVSINPPPPLPLWANEDTVLPVVAEERLVSKRPALQKLNSSESGIGLWLDCAKSWKLGSGGLLCCLEAFSAPEAIRSNQSNGGGRCNLEPCCTQAVTRAEGPRNSETRPGLRCHCQHLDPRSLSQLSWFKDDWDINGIRFENG